MYIFKCKRPGSAYTDIGHRVLYKLAAVSMLKGLVLKHTQTFIKWLHTAWVVYPKYLESQSDFEGCYFHAFQSEFFACSCYANSVSADSIRRRECTSRTAGWGCKYRCSNQYGVSGILETRITPLESFFKLSNILKQVSIYFSCSENAAALFCCEAPEMFCGLRTVYLTFHQHEAEKMMTEPLFLGELIL